MLYNVCPLDYYPQEQKGKFYKRLGNHSGDKLRTIEPLCGTIQADIKETAQGYWVNPEATTPIQLEDPNLSLIYDNMTGSKQLFSMGTSGGDIFAGTYYFEPTNEGYINRNFGEVNEIDKIYCYETQDNSGKKTPFTILLKLVDTKTIEIGKAPTLKCKQLYESIPNKVQFIR